MQELSNQILGGTLTSEQFNQLAEEIQFVIASTGASLGAPVNQFAEALSEYASRNSFYIGTGTANAQILTRQSGFPGFPKVRLGMEFYWRPSVANTGATTLNVESKGVVTIKRESSGADLSANDLITTKDAKVTFDGTNFLLKGF